MASAQELFVSIAGPDPVWQALLGGLVIAALNTFGALLILVWRDPSQRSLDGALGFAAGVMLSASYTSLIIPGIDFAAAPEYDALSIGGLEVAGILPVLVGFVFGVLLLDSGDRWMPRVQRVITGRRVDLAGEDRLVGVLLFIVAITLHNIPEGLAVGAASAPGRSARAWH